MQKKNEKKNSITRSSCSHAALKTPLRERGNLEFSKDKQLPF